MDNFEEIDRLTKWLYENVGGKVERYSITFSSLYFDEDPVVIIDIRSNNKNALYLVSKTEHFTKENVDKIIKTYEVWWK